MTFPDDPQLTNIERPLPELAALRELSSAERPHPSVRRAIKARVRKTLQGSDTRRSGRTVSPRSLLLAAAIVVAVPGALAATATGRSWLEQGFALLPWSNASDSPTNTATKAVTNTASERSRSLDVMPEARRPAPIPPPVSPAPETVASRPEPVDAPRPVQLTPITSTTPHTAAATAPNTRAVPPPPQLQAERRVLESARLALARADYANARYWCDEHRVRFAAPVLEQERAALEALIATGKNSATTPTTRPE